MKLDMLRISRGPWRAPARLVVPPSQGTPTRAISTWVGSVMYGSRMKVGIAPNRGVIAASTGCGKLVVLRSMAGSLSSDLILDHALDHPEGILLGAMAA